MHPSIYSPALMHREELSSRLQLYIWNEVPAPTLYYKHALYTLEVQVFSVKLPLPSLMSFPNREQILPLGSQLYILLASLVFSSWSINLLRSGLAGIQN